MSYARMHKGHSEVYVFASEWGVHCHWCQFGDRDGLAMSYTRAVAHVIRHRLSGHKVPRGVEFEILKDGINPKWRLELIAERRASKRRAAKENFRQQKAPELLVVQRMADWRSDSEIRKATYAAWDELTSEPN